MLRIGAVAFIAVVAAFIGSASAQVSISPELQARMDKEKADRKACKLQICKAFAEPKPDAGPIQCNMIKTWLAGDIQKRILGDHMSWPWGHAQCVADIDLDGGQIAAVMSKPEAVLELKKHTISCKLDEKDATKGAA